jgi:phosphatidylglycerol:prolipoprotein diacylglycerol transferase
MIPFLVPYRSILAAGSILGVVVAIVRSRRWGLRPVEVLDGALAVAVGALLAGRLFYVGASWEYFRRHLLEAPQVWRGGLSAPGAVCGGILGAATLSWVRRRDLRLLLDVLAGGVPVVTFAAWLGCLFRGCAYGIEAWPDQGVWWALSADLPDLTGVQAPRVVVQGLGMVWSVLVLGILLWLRDRGRAFPLWLTLHAGGLLGLAFLRGDRVPWLARLSFEQVVYLCLACAGLVLLIAPGWCRGRGEQGGRDAHLRHRV